MAIPALAKDFKEFLKSLSSSDPEVRNRYRAATVREPAPITYGAVFKSK